MSQLLELRGIAFRYPGSERPVFEDVDFKIEEDERVGLIGPNGCGKTTLLKICIGLLKPARGVILFRGEEVKSDRDFFMLRQSIGYVFQNPDDQLFSPTVLEDVAFGPLNLGLGRDRAEEIARHSLALVGLQGFEDKLTHRLSGGEKRLLSLATILAMKPKAMLLDEPSTGLDLETRQHIIDVLNQLDHGLVVVSHDWDFVSRTTSKFYTIKEGQVVRLEDAFLHQHLHYHPSGDFPHEHFS